MSTTGRIKQWMHTPFPWVFRVFQAFVVGHFFDFTEGLKTSSRLSREIVEKSLFTHVGWASTVVWYSEL